MAELILGDLAGSLFLLGLVMVLVAVVALAGFAVTAAWCWVDSDWHDQALHEEGPIYRRERQ